MLAVASLAQRLERKAPLWHHKGLVSWAICLWTHFPKSRSGWWIEKLNFSYVEFQGHGAHFAVGEYWLSGFKWFLDFSRLASCYCCCCFNTPLACQTWLLSSKTIQDCSLLQPEGDKLVCTKLLGWIKICWLKIYKQWSLWATVFHERKKKQVVKRVQLICRSLCTLLNAHT